MWSESSSVNTVNLVKKICYNSRDIEFFLGITFLQGCGRYFISVLRYKVKKVLRKSNELLVKSTLLENYLSKK